MTKYEFLEKLEAVESKLEPEQLGEFYLQMYRSLRSRAKHLLDPTIRAEQSLKPWVIYEILVDNQRLEVASTQKNLDIKRADLLKMLQDGREDNKIVKRMRDVGINMSTHQRLQLNELEIVGSKTAAFAAKKRWSR